MSKLKIKNKDEKKTLMKLINKYGESYNLLKEEYKSLDNEVRDLRLNLKLNKEIISDILNLNSSNSTSRTLNETKLKNIILKLNTELNTLYSQLEKISKEKFNLRNKILKQNELNEETLEKLKLENEINSNKIFLYEQSLQEKKNMIEKLKTTIEKYKDGIIYEKEIYITKPSKAINQINDELLFYKQIYVKLINCIQRIQSSKEKYENLSEKLQTENCKLRHKYLVSVYSANREKETILTELSALSQNTKKINEDDVRSVNTTFTNYNKERLKKKLNNVNYIYSKTGNAFNEFDEILRACGITMKIYRELCDKKENEKFIEIIEMLFKQILDKNTQISLLEKEIAKLTVKNYELNKSNMNLFVENNNLINNKDNKDSTLNSTLKKYKDNSSIENNAPKSMNRVLILKSLDIYGKQIKKQEEENLNPEDSLSLQKDLDMIIAKKEKAKTEYFNREKNNESDSNESNFNNYFNDHLITVQHKNKNNRIKKNNNLSSNNYSDEESEEESEEVQSKYIEFENEDDNNRVIQYINNSKFNITKNCNNKENNDKINFSCSTVKCDNNNKKNHYLENFFGDSDINNDI